MLCTTPKCNDKPGEDSPTPIGAMDGGNVKELFVKAADIIKLTGKHDATLKGVDDLCKWASGKAR